jgi:hypothetical protein
MVEHGCRAIEEIRVGDTVLTRDEYDPTAAPVRGQVTGLLQSMAPILEVRAGGQVLLSSGPHPLWVRGKGWTAAAALCEGDELGCEAGWVRCAGVVDTGRSEPVYNLEVEGGHTYFAGDPVTWGFALWAHNGCNLNSNTATSNFGIYEIKVNNNLHKIGKADLNRVTQSSGQPTRLHQQVRKLETKHGKGNVEGKVVQDLGMTTTQEAKQAETTALQAYYDKTGNIPIGNQNSFRP